MLLLKQSRDTSSTAKVHGMAYVPPVHKTSAEKRKEKNRPVRLASHVIKVSERVIKKHVINTLVKLSMSMKANSDFYKERVHKRSYKNIL